MEECQDLLHLYAHKGRIFLSYVGMNIADLQELFEDARVLELLVSRQGDNL